MSAQPPVSPPPGLLAGRYRLLDPLGTGGMAMVYRAWDQQKQVFRAVKILERRVAHNERVRKRLLDEAHIMARLQHPNVVTLYEAGSDGDRLYLVMELMLGGSVQDRIVEGPLPPRMAVQVITEVLGALQLAHDAGVVHRDVKPHNILLDANGVPKVTDFGIARMEDGGLTRTGMVLGTLAYMPPEQKLSARKVDARSDLYAAGATLYALLTAREPHDLYAAALDDGVCKELFEVVPPDLTEVIRQATSFRPEDRFASASAMAAALASAAARLPEDPPSPPLVSPDRLAHARAQARLGPTLLGVTESGEISGVMRAVPPTPAFGAPEPERSGVRWLMALGLLAFVALAGGNWVMKTSTAASDVVTPAPAEPPAAKVADAPIVRETGGYTVAVADPGPRAARPRVVREVAADDDPSIEPVAVTERIGAWELQTWPGPRRTRTEALATLPADRVTRGADFPMLALQCMTGIPRLVLRTDEPGFQSEDRFVWVDLILPDRTERLRGEPHPELKGDLLFPKVAAWWDALLAAERVWVRYPPAEGDPIAARFSLGDTSRIREALAAGCR